MTTHGPIDAYNLLSSLVGKTVYTLTRKQPNKILGFDGPTVLVETKSSPDQPVPVEEVQNALDRLVAGEAIEVNPASLGYRSSFVGAVLAEVPGVVVEGARPKVVRLP